MRQAETSYRPTNFRKMSLRPAQIFPKVIKNIRFWQELGIVL
jgi:hypothetical protein